MTDFHRQQAEHLKWALDLLRADFNKRHAWLSPAAEQVRQWKAEDEANGMPWGDESIKQERKAGNRLAKGNGK